MPASKWKQMDLFAHNRPAGHAAPKQEISAARHLGRALALFEAMRQECRRRNWWPEAEQAHRDFADAVRLIAKTTDLRPLRSAVPAMLRDNAGDEVTRCLEAAAKLPDHAAALTSARKAVEALVALIRHKDKAARGGR